MAPSSLLPTGIRNFDSLLGGGLAPSTNVLLYGDPLCGKKPMLMQFIYEGLKLGIPGIFVLTDYGFSDWKRMMESSGWRLAEFEKNGLLQIVDCFSKQFDPALVDEGIVTYVNGPSDLSSISVQVSVIQDQIVKISETHRIGFHSVSSLLETNSPESVFRFMQFVMGKFRKAGATAMYVVEKGMHEEKDIKMLEHLMDGAVEFSEDKLRIRGLMGASASWHNYSVSSKGVEIKV